MLARTTHSPPKSMAAPFYPAVKLTACPCGRPGIAVAKTPPSMFGLSAAALAQCASTATQ